MHKAMKKFLYAGVFGAVLALGAAVVVDQTTVGTAAMADDDDDGGGGGLGVGDVTEADLLAWTSEFRRWGEFENSGLGAANFITPENRKEAAELVELGLSVSMSRPVVQDSPESGFPQLPPSPAPPNRLIRTIQAFNAPFISDSYAYTGTYHGSTHSHVDALGCHVLFQAPDLAAAAGWNGFTAAEIQTAFGCPEAEGGVSAMRHGIFTRGILLDIPLLKGVDWLANADNLVTGADIVAFEELADVEIGPGDIILLYTGRWKREAAGVPGGGFAGYHASAIPLMHDRKVSYIGSDGIGDAFPTGFPGSAFVLPVHQIVMPFLGVNILDNLDLELVAEFAREVGRWEFLITAGPLHITDGMGSPLNPIATF